METLKSNLEQEAQILREQIATATHRLNEIEVFLRLAIQFTARFQSNQGLAQVLVSNRMRQVSQRERVVATAAKILSDGRPRGIKELRADLETSGVRIGGADPVQTLSTYLSRDPKFRSEPHNGNWTWSLAPALVSESGREWVENLRCRRLDEPGDG